MQATGRPATRPATPLQYEGLPTYHSITQEVRPNKATESLLSFVAMLLLLPLGAPQPQAEVSTALSEQRSTPLDTAPALGSISPMELCKRTWTKAVEAMPESPEGDSRPELRGDAFRTKTPPSLLFVHVGKTCGAP